MMDPEFYIGQKVKLDKEKCRKEWSNTDYIDSYPDVLTICHCVLARWNIYLYHFDETGEVFAEYWLLPIDE